MSAEDPSANGPEDLGWTPVATGRAPLRFPIPPASVPKPCRSCAAPIHWIVTPHGKRMPANPDGTSHFSTCPNAAEHRRPKPAAQRPLELKEIAVLRGIARGKSFSRRTDNLFALALLETRKLIEKNALDGYPITDAGVRALERLDQGAR